jgi:tetratricopeptide (TPR) repeat protein
MGTMGATVAEASRTNRLLGYLEHDPENLQLICDAAEAAVAEGDDSTATAMLEKHEALAPLPPPMLNLRGLAALKAGRFDDAAAAFTSLREAGEDAPAVRLNLAWALTMNGHYADALPLVDAEVVALNPSGAGLRIRLLHHLDRSEEAMEEGGRMAELYPGDHVLMGTLANAALDADRADLARHYAERAGSHHDGLSTMGLLLLDEDRVGESAALFDRILAADIGNPRALLGKGLERLAVGDTSEATLWLDRAAERFGDHLGTWVAAGWAWYVQGDLAAARARFETAQALDDTFAETQGGLAVLDIAEGRIEEGRRRAEVALRLDRASFGAALATILLLEHDGKPEMAKRISEAAFNVPIGIGGKTLAQALAARTRRG